MEVIPVLLEDIRDNGTKGHGQWVICLKTSVWDLISRMGQGDRFSVLKKEECQLFMII